MTATIEPAEDLRRRWRPSPNAVDAAVRALQNTPDADLAIVPMYQPGKAFGFWTVGQQVETVDAGPDDVLLAVSGHEPRNNLPAFRTAQDVAFERASAKLAEHGRGTTAYAVVRRDATWAVFEEILSARD